MIHTDFHHKGTKRLTARLILIKDIGANLRNLWIDPRVKLLAR